MSSSGLTSPLSFNPLEGEFFEQYYKDIDGNLYTKNGRTLIQYAIGKTEKDLASIMNRSIVPLLYEYFFDDKNKVQLQLKKALDGLDYEVVNASMGRLKVVKKAGK